MDENTIGRKFIDRIVAIIAATPTKAELKKIGLTQEEEQYIQRLLMEKEPTKEVEEELLFMKAAMRIVGIAKQSSEEE